MLRTFIAASAGSLILLGSAAGLAQAAPVSDTTTDLAGVVCQVLDDYPTPSGVAGVGLGLVTQLNVSPARAGEIIATSVLNVCPRHLPTLQAFIAQYAPERAA